MVLVEFLLINYKVKINFGKTFKEIELGLFKKIFGLEKVIATGKIE